MSANGISTLPNKSDRVNAKLSLAQTKRSVVGTIGYRPFHNLNQSEIFPPRTTPLPLGRPWTT